MTRLVLPSLLFLAGCIGDITNSIFDEDKVFLAALPSAENTRIDVDDGSSSTARTADDPCSLDSYSLAGKPQGLVLTISTAVSVNCGVSGQLAAIDYLRTLPPTDRTTNGRTWGPYELDKNQWLEAEIVRTGSTYDWAVMGSTSEDGPWVDWFTGQHLAGETVARGLGEMAIDYGAIARINGEDWQGVTSATYDLRQDRELFVNFDDVQMDDMERSITADYWFAEDGDARDFEFRSAADWLGDDGLDEEGEIRTRWIPGEGGRSDAWVSGGTLDDLGVESIQVTQCWNSRGKLVYQADSLGYTQDGGDVADCVYTDVGELEHIQGSVHE